MRIIQVIIALIFLSSIALARRGQLPDFDYGDIKELKGVTRIFVSTQGDKKLRDKIAAYIERKLPELEVLLERDEAEVIIAFGQFSNYGTGYVVKHPDSGKPRLLMNWNGRKGILWNKDTATEFADEFIKAYRKANEGLAAKKQVRPEEDQIPHSLKDSAQPVGDNWIKVVDSNDSKMYYDPQSLMRANEMVKVWLIVVWQGRAKANYIEKRRSNGYSIKDYDQYSHSMNLQEYDCVERKVRQLAVVDYGGRKKVLSSLTNDDLSDWSYVIPESIGDDILKKVCVNMK